MQKENPEKPRILLVGPTAISAGKIGEATIHFVLEVKPGSKLYGLNDKVKALLINNLSEQKLLINDKIFMVSCDLGTGIDDSLSQIFSISIELAFAGLPVVFHMPEIHILKIY